MIKTNISKSTSPKHTFYRSIVTSVKFHPKEENLMLTTGLDRRAKLISVQSDSMHKLVQSVFLEDLPIYSGEFINQGR